MQELCLPRFFFFFLIECLIQSLECSVYQEALSHGINIKMPLAFNVLYVPSMVSYTLHTYIYIFLYLWLRWVFAAVQAFL